MAITNSCDKILKFFRFLRRFFFQFVVFSVSTLCTAVVTLIKYLSLRSEMGLWTGFVWLRIGTRGMLLCSVL